MFEKLRKLQLVLLGVILALGLLFSVNAAVSGLSKDKITVTGSAFKVVESDSARLEFEIASRKPNKQLAYAAVKEQLPVVIEYLKSKGIENIEVNSSHGYISYRYSPNGVMTNEVAFYNLSQPVVVKSDDVKKIKEVSSEIQGLLVEKGVDINVFSTQYFYSKLSDLKVELLEDATKDAQNRAKAMLKATHNHPGKIEAVQMGVFQITPVDSTNVSDMGVNDTSTIDKKVTAVANVVFRIK